MKKLPRSGYSQTPVNGKLTSSIDFEVWGDNRPKGFAKTIGATSGSTNKTSLIIQGLYDLQNFKIPRYIKKWIVGIANIM